jgi:PhzF family phenazine biosynthesis protein
VTEQAAGRDETTVGAIALDRCDADLESSRSYCCEMRIWIVDAFAERPFAGNPAGVCLLDSGDWPEAEWMRQVAAELSCETAFARPLADEASADWALRWFTPAAESNLCGHATLATAHILRPEPAARWTVRFASQFGILIAWARDDGTISLDFPAASVTVVPAPAGLDNALGVKLAATYRTGALGDLLAVAGDEATVRGLRPDFTAVERLTRREGIRGIILTSAATNPDRGYDFVSRYFAPAGGIPEDPVTGSAHTALGPYWSQRLGRNSLAGLQASARTGLVATTVLGDRVHLNGQAVTVLEGTLRPEVAANRRSWRRLKCAVDP